ncbi:MAG: hypothetical protein QOF29_4061 [bacterium]
MASAREAPQGAAPPAEPAAGAAAGPAGPGGGRAGATPVAASVALGVVLLAGLLLRLDNIAHGLPFVYHADEAQHFTSRAVAMFGGDLDPHYFQNPSAFTYLLHGVLRLTGGDVAAAYASDPTDAFLTGRLLAAVLCLLGAAGVFAVGRRLWGPGAGVTAAAVLTFAFLPVAYSRFALTDVGVFLPVALAVYATIRVHEAGSRRWFLVAGAAIGLAVGFKYTAGLLVVPFLVAAVLRARGGQARVWREAALALVVAALVFLATTPYFLLDLRVALYQLKVQQQQASLPKLGPAAQDGTVVFYLRTLTWGLGWAALAAAAVGLVSEWRRDRTRALLLALFPLLLFVHLSTQGRAFARWLMPAYPVLALLAGVGLARLAGAVSHRPVVRAGVLVGLLAAVLAQPVRTDVRTARVLGRTDTRQLTRDHLLAALPRGARVVVEPAFPVGFFGRRLVLGFGPPPKPPASRAGSVTRFIRSLRPQRIDRYRRAGYCVVVSTSDVRERARARRAPRVEAYYRRLARESRVVYRASPYRRGARPVPFDFDLSTHLYVPPAYERPGPAVTIYRLRDCRAPARA